MYHTSAMETRRAGDTQPVAVVLRFIDCINRRDVEGMGRLMSAGHELRVFSEEPVVGREANVEAWRGYGNSFPDYVIYPRQISEYGGVVSVLGHTTRSHLGLLDEQERRLTLIWQAGVTDGLLDNWTLLDDSPENRREFGLLGEPGEV